MRLRAAVGGIALLVVVSLFLTAASYRGRLIEARANLARATAQIQAYQESARVLDDHLRLVQQERDKWRVIAEELKEVEGANENLNAYERAVFERLRHGTNGAAGNTR